MAGLYREQSAGNVLVTHGAIGANALVHETLVEPGDHVISVLPTYQQIGFLAPALLMVLRLVQGFAVAGEISIATAVSSIVSPPK